MRYLFVNEGVHVVHRLGAVVCHDSVEELGDELVPLSLVRGNLLCQCASFSTSVMTSPV